MLLASVFDHVQSHDLIPIVAIGGGCLVAIVSSLAYAWRKSREVGAMTELKRDLIAQGRPTDEIERICNAGVSKKCG